MARLIALILAFGLAASGAGCSGCATALLEGVLVADGAGGLGVGSDGGELVLTNSFGQPIAHQGAFVSMAGGVPGDGPEFAACGPIAVSASGPPPR